MSRPHFAWAHTTIDSCDPERAAVFWGRLLDLEPVPRQDGWYVLGPTATGGPMLYFQPVPEPKIGKTPVHIDLWVDHLPEAIELVEKLGGRRTAESRDVRGGTLAVMADPDGTEFCLITFPL
ncbi:MAG: VOC family protein [Actinomycetota bacterium]|nr:VOC family protein [Actinomycetota bacterium]